MRISFYGSSLVSCFWNGAATYYRGLLKALATRGHEITFYEPDAFGRQDRRDMPNPDWCRVVVWPASHQGMVDVLEDGRGAGLVVKASGVGVFDSELEAGVLAHRRPGSKIAFWDVDAPATLDRVEGNPGDPFRALIPRYDRVFTYGGGDPVVRAYERLGAKACVPIYNALDPTTHFAVGPDPRFAAELGFLGNRLPDREARVEEFFFGAAELLPQAKFILGGAGWDDRPMPSNVRYVGHVGTADHNAFNCSVRAVLNVNRASMAAYGFSPPTRVFEAAGAAACLITDDWTGVERFLEPGREILVARDGPEVAHHLAGLGAARARALGAAAQSRVLAEHTYALRAVEVESALRGRSVEDEAA